MGKQLVEQTESTPQPDPNFHGAAWVDKQGNEIPITEPMIRDACNELEKQ